MKKYSAVVIALLIIFVVVLTLVLLSDTINYISAAEETKGWNSFKDVLLFVLGGILSFGIAYYFFYKEKLAELNAQNFRACANYDEFVKALKKLKNPHVNNLIVEYIGTIEAPELYIYDSFFLKFAESLAASTKQEKRRLLVDLNNMIKPTVFIAKDVSCAVVGCGGYLRLSMAKGQHYIVPCPQCGIQYKCYITKNDKIICRQIHLKYGKLTAETLEQNLPEFLSRGKLLISKEDMAIIAKRLVNMINRDPDTTYYMLKKELVVDKVLCDQLDDINDAVHLLDALAKSKSFLISDLTGTFPGWNKSLNMKTSEMRIYISYIIRVAHVMMTERSAFVNRFVVKKLIRMLLPEGAITDANINEVTYEILIHIKSDDKYPDWETE
jgi:hypothetical protein